MSIERASSPFYGDATPRVDGDETALRLACGRHTVDIVHARGQLLTLIGSGVGTEPTVGTINAPTLAVLLAIAASVDVRSSWETQAWPLAC